MTAKETWKPVTIGGLTGILMGAGTMYAMQTSTSGNDEVASSVEEVGLKVATVDDSMSFNDAFGAARGEVGPGGVFTWRGNIYNTYTAEEWKAMSDDEKDLFANQVKPEISPANIDTNKIAENAQADNDVRIAENTTPTQHHDVEVQVEVGVKVDGHRQTTTWNELAEDENDVRIVGFKDIEVAPGRSVTMQELDINGQRVAIIDVDKDGDPDLAMTDLNHNQQMDEGEVIDLHTGEAISFANDDSSVDNTPDLDSFTA